MTFPIEWVAAATAGIFGLLIGSFLNVVIYRLPKMLEKQWLVESEAFLATSRPSAEPRQAQEDFPASDSPEEAASNLLVPRSSCPHCGHCIRWYENIPVASWLLLGRKCSSCRAPISGRYPGVEVLTAALFAICGWKWGLGLQTLAWCGFSAALVSLTFIDWDTTLLPDDITLPLVWAGICLSGLDVIDVPLGDSVWGAVVGYLSLWTVYWLFKLATGKEGMGYGDFKLFAALGAWFGWQSLLPIILIASILGAIVGIAIKLANRLRDGGYVPFGPFLALGGAVTMILGPAFLLAWIGLQAG